MKNKKIFLIGTTASNLYLFRKDFIISCIEQGHQVFTLVSEYDDIWLDKIKSLSVEVITYDLSRSGLNPLNDLNTISAKENNFKLSAWYCFFIFSKPVIYGSLAARLSKVPNVIGMIEGLGSPFTEHPTGQSLKMKLVQFFQVSLYRIVFPFIDKIIFLNEDDPKDLVVSKKYIIVKMQYKL